MTSEGVSKRILARHTYVHVYMLRNLPRKGFEELVHQLEPPKGIDVEELWVLTGGNPRVLIEVAQLDWDVSRWLRYVAEQRVSPAIHGLESSRVLKLVDDPDSDPELARVLEERGLMIELNRVLTVRPPPSEDLEIGVGKRWAWQVPAYRKALKSLLAS